MRRGVSHRLLNGRRMALPEMIENESGCARAKLRGEGVRHRGKKITLSIILRGY